MRTFFGIVLVSLLMQLAACASGSHASKGAKQGAAQGAAKAQQSDNPNFRLAGLWLEVLNYADSRQEDRARSLLPVIVAEDWDIKTEAEAEQAMRQEVAELTDIRREFKLPLVCTT